MKLQPMKPMETRMKSRHLSEEIVTTWGHILFTSPISLNLAVYLSVPQSFSGLTLDTWSIGGPQIESCWVSQKSSESWVVWHWNVSFGLYYPRFGRTTNPLSLMIRHDVDFLHSSCQDPIFVGLLELVVPLPVVFLFNKWPKTQMILLVRKSPWHPLTVASYIHHYTLNKQSITLVSPVYPHQKYHKIVCVYIN